MVSARRLALLTALLLALFAPSTLAADKKKAEKPETAVKEEARVTVVEVPVNVLDKDGRPVENLTADDFQVFDDGKLQKISGFDVVDERHSIPRPAEGEPPINPAARRHFLIVFDLSFSTPKGIINARRAARDFVVTRMKELDLAAIADYSVETGMKLLVSFTGDRTQLAAAVDTIGFPGLAERSSDPLSMTIQPPTQSNASGFAYLPSSGSSGGQVNNADSILQDILENLQVQRQRELRAIYRDRVTRLMDSFSQMAQALDAVKGRKHILYLSEGFDSREISGSTLQGGGSVEGEWVIRGESYKVDSDARFGNGVLRSQMNKALELFNRSDCVIHTIDIAGIRALSDPAGSTAATLDGQEALFTIAHQTGGEFLRNSNDLGDSFDRLLERTGLIYVLAFQLVRVPETGKFHTLKVKPKNSSYRVSARSGYYEAKPYDKFSPVEKKLMASSALAAAVPRSDIPAWVLASPLPSQGDSARVPVVVEVPGDRLLAKSDGPQISVDLYLYAVDQKHETKDYLFQSLTLDLTKLREKLRKTGLKYYGEMNLPAGEYTLRVLVRNNNTGQFGVSVVPLSVPAALDAFTSPPLFLEEGRDWVMVKAKNRVGADRGGAYPFAFGPDAFVPAAWERGQWLIDAPEIREQTSHDPDAKYAPKFWREKSWPRFTSSILKDLDTDPLPVREKFVQHEFDLVRKLRKAGVPFLAGTDTAAGVDVLPGFSLHRELERFVAAGFTPMEALQTATINPAKFLNKLGDFGTVEKGKVADLVLLDANPLDDIRNTQKIAAVIVSGRYFSRANLDSILREVEIYASAH